MKIFRIALSIFSVSTVLTFSSCIKSPDSETEKSSGYFAKTADSIQSGGVKVVSISTPKGNFNVWTKRFGNNPKIKLLLLNGGPGMSHEYFECLENFLPEKEIEFIYYDQLGTGFSDNPN